MITSTAVKIYSKDGDLGTWSVDAVFDDESLARPSLTAFTMLEKYEAVPDTQGVWE